MNAPPHSVTEPFEVFLQDLGRGLIILGSGLGSFLITITCLLGINALNSTYRFTAAESTQWAGSGVAIGVVAVVGAKLLEDIEHKATTICAYVAGAVGFATGYMFFNMVLVNRIARIENMVR